MGVLEFIFGKGAPKDDTAPKQAYYLDNDSDRVINGDSDSHFLAPVAMARLDHSDREVYLEGVNTNLIGGVPRYRRGSELTPHYELATVNYYADSDANSEYNTNYRRNRYDNFDSSKFRSLDDSFYTSGYFNDDRYYNRHREAITSKGL